MYRVRKEVKILHDQEHCEDEKLKQAPQKEDVTPGSASSKKAGKRGAYKRAFRKCCSWVTCKRKEQQRDTAEPGTQQCRGHSSARQSMRPRALNQDSHDEHKYYRPQMDRKSCLQNV